MLLDQLGEVVRYAREVSPSLPTVAAVRLFTCDASLGATQAHELWAMGLGSIE